MCWFSDAGMTGGSTRRGSRRPKSAKGVVDWHNPPRRELVIWLTGEVELETSDGDIRRLAAGNIVLAEDRTGKGHSSRHPAEGQLVVHVDLC
jgi:quercetin dioxygenase-like cupin family protein